MKQPTVKEYADGIIATQAARIEALTDALNNALRQLYATDDDCGHPVELYQQIETALADKIP